MSIIDAIVIIVRALGPTLGGAVAAINLIGMYGYNPSYEPSWGKVFLALFIGTLFSLIGREQQ